MPLVKPLARTRSVATDDSLTIADSKSRRGLNPAAFYVLLGNKLFHLRLHPCQERFSRSRPYPGPLKLEDFLALSTNLRAHALDFRAEYSIGFGYQKKTPPYLACYRRELSCPGRCA
jgi:hypothetical protein